jgi:hypothetical protein
VMECHLYIRDKFPSLFEDVVPGCLKSFFHLDHEVDVSLYLTESTTLCDFRELASMNCHSTFSPISLFGFPNFKINFISFHFI